MLDFGFLKDVVAVLGFVLAVVSAIYTFFATRQTKVDERFKVGSDRMDRHEARIAALEQNAKAAPTKDDLHQIELSMSKLSGTLERMEAVMQGNQQIMGRLESIVTRHETHLLNKS